MTHEKYCKLVSNNNTQNYRKAEENISYAIATECQILSRKHNIENHQPCTNLIPAFITIKDHKENFLLTPNAVNSTQQNLISAKSARTLSTKLTYR